MNNQPIRYGVSGSGWRAEFYLRIAQALPEKFQVAGVVSRDAAKRERLQQIWNTPVFATPEELWQSTAPDFMVVSVSKSAAAAVIDSLAAREIPVLAETPPATSVEGLTNLFQSVGTRAKIQIAEQFHLQPMHAAALAVIDSGKLGEIRFVHASVNQGYHNLSLIRKALGIRFENARIEACRFEFPVVEGPGRNGQPAAERIIQNEHLLALIDFGGKVGWHDVEQNQHRSWIRSGRFLARGSHGEIENTTVKYLKNFSTPVEYDLKRQTAGADGNLEGYYLKGILAGTEWVYQNPFIPARFSDEEIAIATCLVKMKEYLDTGRSFYSLAEACQDQYLALLLEESWRTRKPVQSETQVWAKS